MALPAARLATRIGEEYTQPSNLQQGLTPLKHRTINQLYLRSDLFPAMGRGTEVVRRRWRSQHTSPMHQKMWSWYSTEEMVAEEAAAQVRKRLQEKGEVRLSKEVRDHNLARGENAVARLAAVTPLSLPTLPLASKANQDNALQQLTTAVTHITHSKLQSSKCRTWQWHQQQHFGHTA